MVFIFISGLREETRFHIIVNIYEPITLQEAFEKAKSFQSVMECQISENAGSKEIKTEVLPSTEILSRLENTVKKLEQHVSHFS